jgi:hypothetical protein
MAKAPTCKVCGAAHWSGQPHAFAQRAAVEHPRAETVKPAAKRAVAPSALTPASDPPDALASYLAEKRAAQAAYMRDYRAKKRP